MAYRHSTQSGLPPQPSKFAALGELLDSVDSTDLLAGVRSDTKRGPQGQWVEPIWRAYLASFVLNLAHTNDIIRNLQDIPAFRQVCEFGDDLPHRTTFNRVIQRFALHPDAVERCIIALTNELKGHLPDLGEEVAIDATAVRSHSNPHKARENRPPSDPDAAWGFKHSVRSKDKEGTEYFFGFKMHMVADANYGLPLAFHVTPGNESDSPELPKVMTKAFETYDWFQPSVATADRGYDAASNFKYLYGENVDPIIHIRKPGARDGLHGGVYNKDLLPLCVGNVPMEFVGTAGEGQYIYRCRDEGCHLKDSLHGGTRHCDNVFTEDATASPEMMRILGPITRRDSPEWKAFYAKRWSVERLFKTLKESRRLETHCVRGKAQITLHMLMSTLAFQASALAEVRAGNSRRMRWAVRKVA